MPRSQKERREERLRILKGDQGFISRGAHERTGHRLGSHRSGAVSLFDDVDIHTTSPVDGQALVYDDANEEWIPGSVGEADRGIKATSYTDFYASLAATDGGGGWITPTASNVSAVPGESGRPGIVSLSTLTSTTGNAIVSNGTVFASANPTALGDGKKKLAVWFKTPTVLSDATNRYILGFVLYGVRSDLSEEFGFSGTGANAVGLIYRDDINSGNWTLRKRNGSTNTDVDTGEVVVADTWYLVELESNAAGTAITVWIDNVKVIDASTGGLPDVADGPFTTYFGIRKFAGDGARALLADVAYTTHTFTTPRKSLSS